MACWEKNFDDYNSNYRESNHKIETTILQEIQKNQYEDSLKKVTKGVRRMPRLSEAMKDVTSCDKLRGLANMNRSEDFRMGQPTCKGIRKEANPGN